MLRFRKVVNLLSLFSLLLALSAMNPAYSQEQDLPDLVISSITHTPNLPHPSDWVTMTFTVENIGTAAAPASVARVTIDGGDATTHNVPALEPGETYQFQRTDKIVAFGKHTVTAVADWNDVVDESNEDNNSTTIFIYVAKQNTYDLTLETLTHAPQNPTNYDMIAITAIVRNVGPLTPTTSTLEIRIVGEATPATYLVPPLAPTETYQAVRHVNLPPGAYQVIATADLYDEINEAYEDNNTATDSFNVAQDYLPDLVVESFTHSPMNPYTIDTITLTAVVRNIGNAEATSSTLEIKVGDEIVPALFDIPTLAIDEATSVQRQIILSEPGTYQAKATADIFQELVEWDEINNIAFDTIDVEYPPIPDLIVDILTHSPEDPFTGDLITITAVVKNIGWLEASTSTLALLVDSALTDYAVPPLAPDAVFEIQRNEIFTTAGIYLVTAIADADDDIVEFDEDNNAKEDSFFVKKSGPDLEVTSFYHSPVDPTVHDIVTITAVVENTGNETATFSILSVQADNEVDPHEYNVPELAPGETFHAQTLINFHDPGTYVITATADAWNDVEESYENNNEATDIITVVLPILPDLVISDITSSKANPNIGEVFTITVEVKNIGLADAGSTSTLSILAGDEVIPEFYLIPSLDIGTTFTVQRNLSFPENLSYLITATADVDDQIFEIYEDNNSSTFEIFIGSIFARLKDYLLGRIDLTEAEKVVADANKDGKIDMADLVYLLITGNI